MTKVRSHGPVGTYPSRALGRMGSLGVQRPNGSVSGLPAGVPSAPPIEGGAAFDEDSVMVLTTRMLTPDTWEDFAALVESNNGVWGGCWCIGFHPGGSTGTREGNRDAKQQLVERGIARQVLVYDEGRCVGWCQFGTPPELPNIKSRRAYDAEAQEPPDWRIGCIFTNSRDRGKGIASAAVRGAWTRSSALAEASSRHTRSRPRIDRRSAARISTPAPKSCTHDMGSCGTAASPSGGGLCALTSDHQRGTGRRSSHRQNPPNTRGTRTVTLHRWPLNGRRACPANDHCPSPRIPERA